MRAPRPDGGEQSPADPGAGWGLDLRVWLERAGRAVLGPGRLELLEGIARGHSISSAARRMRMSYRRAWELVRDINEAAGEPLVTAAPGGPGGGGAALTPLGRWAVAALREAQDQLRRTAAGLSPGLRGHDTSSTLHVAAAVSLEEVTGQLLTDFAAREPGLCVRAVYGASDELADHLLSGAPGDVFLTADPLQIERLGATHLVRKGQQVALAENGLAAIGRADGGPSVRTPADLAKGRPGRVALASPSCPLGRYTRAYLERLHLYEALQGRAVWVENSRAAVTAVRAGQADVALAYSSDAARSERCRTLFRVRRPPSPIRYSGAVLCRAHDPAAARRLLAFFTSPAAARRFRQCGFAAARPRD